MGFSREKPYLIKLIAGCKAIQTISIWKERGQETAKKIWQLIVWEVALYFIFHNKIDNPYLSWEDDLLPHQIWRFHLLLNKLLRGKKELNESEKIKLCRFLPPILKVATVKVNNFQDWKEEDDKLKKDVALVKTIYDIYMEYLKKQEESEAQADIRNNSDPNLSQEKNRKTLIKPNNKDVKSSLRRYQCQYGCLTVFSRKLELFRHQKKTNRACKFSNADPLPVTHPQKQSELAMLAMLAMISKVVNQLDDSRPFLMLSLELLPIFIATLHRIIKFHEGKYKGEMKASLDSDDDSWFSYNADDSKESAENLSIADSSNDDAMECDEN